MVAPLFFEPSSGGGGAGGDGAIVADALGAAGELGGARLPGRATRWARGCTQRLHSPIGWPRASAAAGQGGRAAFLDEWPLCPKRSDATTTAEEARCVAVLTLLDGLRRGTAAW